MKKRKNYATFSKSKGLWVITYNLGKSPEGKYLRKTFSATTRREAEKKYRAFKEEIRRANSKYHQCYTKDKFDDLLYEWLDTVKTNPNIKSSTVIATNTIVRAFASKFQGVPINKITMSMLTDFVKDKERGTQITYLSKIKQFYRWYLATYKISPSENIFNNFTMPRRIISKDNEYISDDDIYKILSDTSDRVEVQIAQLILYTGMRVGEALSLKVSDIDIKNRNIHIQRTIRKSFDKKGKVIFVVGDSPKSLSSDRYIPLCNDAIRLIQSLIKDKQPQDLLFFRSRNRQYQLDWFRFNINKFYKENDINIRGGHILRHTYATALFCQGLPINIISKILGHSTVEMTSRVYVHINDLIQYSHIPIQNFNPMSERLKRFTLVEPVRAVQTHENNFEDIFIDLKKELVLGALKRDDYIDCLEINGKVVAYYKTYLNLNNDYIKRIHRQIKQYTRCYKVGDILTKLSS